MSSLLLIFVCSLVINSQARTLTENRDHQAPLWGTGVAVLNPGFIEMIKGYGKDKPKRAPPSPKEAPPTHQVSGLGNLGKEGGEVVPPPPHHAPPTHQVTGGGGLVAQENYGKEGGHLAPPPPHHAPPTHQVSGGRAAEMEESWAAYVLLSASA